MLAGRRARLRLVIFDCDGVLVNSEPIANRLVAASLAEAGWPITPAEAQSRFLGMALRDMVPVIEAQIGRPLPEGWSRRLADAIYDALSTEAELIPGAAEALHAVTALGLPWRIASNSSHEEMAAKFGRTGLTHIVAGRIHSHRDVPRGKPAPDLFLAAAAAEGVPPDACIVIEDSIPGITGAVAAGMDCLGYAPHDDGAHLRAAGAHPFHAMTDLADLLALALKADA
jgi:HAD superfamily hydrolase (TIGR01509 family)